MSKLDVVRRALCTSGVTRSTTNFRVRGSGLRGSYNHSQSHCSLRTFQEARNTTHITSHSTHPRLRRFGHTLRNHQHHSAGEHLHFDPITIPHHQPNSVRRERHVLVPLDPCRGRLLQRIRRLERRRYPRPRSLLA